MVTVETKRNRVRPDQAERNRQARRAKVLIRAKAIDLDTVLRVADRVSSGVPLFSALCLESEPLTMQAWERAMVQRQRWNRLFEQKIAQRFEADLASIHGTTAKDLPVGTCWILERRWPQHFSTRTNGVNVTVNNLVVGIENDVLKRSRAMVVNDIPAMKQPPRAGRTDARALPLTEARNAVQTETESADLPPPEPSIR